VGAPERRSLVLEMAKSLRRMTSAAWHDMSLASSSCSLEEHEGWNIRIAEAETGRALTGWDLRNSCSFSSCVAVGFSTHTPSASSPARGAKGDISRETASTCQEGKPNALWSRGAPAPRVVLAVASRDATRSSKHVLASHRRRLEYGLSPGERLTRFGFRCPHPHAGSAHAAKPRPVSVTSDMVHSDDGTRAHHESEGNREVETLNT
jgi:hypothetical protein